MKGRKTISIITALAMLLSSCTACAAGVPPFRETDDEQAAAMQKLMRSTVKVNVDTSIELQGVLEFPGGWMGSGTVIAVDESKGVLGEAMVLTAGHVCIVPPEADTPLGKGKVTSARVAVTNIEGKRLPAVPLYATMEPDICVLRVEGIPGPAVELADELPPVGAVIQSLGYPLGVSNNGAMFSSDGRYIGLREGFEGKDLLVSSPSAPGLSGSGLFYRGKQFGILVAVYVRFHHMTVGTSLVEIRKAILIAGLKWHDL